MAVDIRMEDYVTMYGEGTNCRSKRRGGYRFQASRSRGKTQQNRSGDWCLFFFYLSSAGLQHKRKEEERMMERKCEEVLDLSRSICGG